MAESPLLALTAFKNTFFIPKTKLSSFPILEMRTFQKLYIMGKLLSLNYVRLNDTLLNNE